MCCYKMLYRKTLLDNKQIIIHPNSLQILRINHKHIYTFLFLGIQRRNPLSGQRRRLTSPLFTYFLKKLSLYKAHIEFTYIYPFKVTTFYSYAIQVRNSLLSSATVNSLSGIKTILLCPIQINSSVNILCASM